ncbi:uncharacterized protein EV420DRAFT_1480678 [Desarmillaria tabescens]|uniref:Uncharacterized protein n=1 Tax=Armillaria tabescens TaxID=1929756 RepID=A0AA39K9X6_ARMTA|nr:uncharacterized protein EV420DRAFT_1480678 [Desarmillaria tabescens]KAK0457195.1 hypothetical protein EV420DRAFT_1480678 [Desarmillaria tabescens]
MTDSAHAAVIAVTAWKLKSEIDSCSAAAPSDVLSEANSAVMVQKFYDMVPWILIAAQDLIDVKDGFIKVGFVTRVCSFVNPVVTSVTALRDKVDTCTADEDKATVQEICATVLEKMMKVKDTYCG